MTTRPTDPVTLSITFLYYRDLANAMTFYEEVMGFTLAIDQGWSKIYAIGGGAHIGRLDDVHGVQKCAANPRVQSGIRGPVVAGRYAGTESQKVSHLADRVHDEVVGVSSGGV